MTILVDIGTDATETTVLLAGQFVISGPQLVMVTSAVLYNVIVDGVGVAVDAGDTSVEVAADDVVGIPAGVIVDGHAVMMAGLLET